MPAKVLEGETVRPRADDLVRSIRYHHLTAMGRRSDARRTVDVHADVPVLVARGLTRVDPHAHAHTRALRPGMQAERPLRLHGSAQSLASGLEDDEETVALRTHLMPTPCRDGLAHDHPMRGQDARVVLPQPAQQARRSLDVAEQQRQGAEGEWRRHPQQYGRRSGTPRRSLPEVAPDLEIRVDSVR